MLSQFSETVFFNFPKETLNLPKLNDTQFDFVQSLVQNLQHDCTSGKDFERGHWYILTKLKKR